MQPVTKLLDTPLKLIGAVTALISLVLGASQVVKVVGESRERRRQVAELQRVASEQQKSGDYAAAWATLTEASKIDGQAVRTAQEDVAMAWLRDEAAIASLVGITFCPSLPSRRIETECVSASFRPTTNSAGIFASECSRTL